MLLFLGLHLGLSRVLSIKRSFDDQNFDPSKDRQGESRFGIKVSKRQMLI